MRIDDRHKDERIVDNASPGRIAIYIPSLAGGGAETSMLRLCAALQARGYAVDLVVNRQTGPGASRVPGGVRVVELRRQGKWLARFTAWRAYPADWRHLLRPVVATRKPLMSLPYLASLAAYLRDSRPSVMISAMYYANLLAVWARGLSHVGTQLVVTEHTTVSRNIAARDAQARQRGRWRYLPPLLARVYRRADAIVTVSAGVGDDLVALTGLPRDRLTTIYNPVVWPGLAEAAGQPVSHPWFANPEVPVVLAVGRLEKSKDYPTLIKAFARLRAERRVRLVILGEGRLRPLLETQVEQLGVTEDVALPGWVDNPYAWMRQADLFALSSSWEGLGNVLIEAMACGCSLVSTDCDSGPREILENGRYGALVPVGDAAALTRAMAHALEHPCDADTLRRRADSFSVRAAADRYDTLIQTLINTSRGG